jgi:hypothetical protein
MIKIALKNRLDNGSINRHKSPDVHKDGELSTSKGYRPTLGGRQGEHRSFTRTKPRVGMEALDRGRLQD